MQRDLRQKMGGAKNARGWVVQDRERQIARDALPLTS